MKPFKKIAFTIISMALSMLDSRLAELIAEPWILQFVKTKLEAIRGTVRIYGDENPDNKAQMKEFYAVQLPKIIKTDFEIVKVYAIEKVKNQQFEKILSYHSDVASELLQAVTDADPNNKEQIQAIIDKYDEGSIDVSLEWLIEKAKNMKDETKKMFIVSFLEEIKAMEITEL